MNDLITPQNLRAKLSALKYNQNIILRKYNIKKKNQNLRRIDYQDT